MSFHFDKMRQVIFIAAILVIFASQATDAVFWDGFRVKFGVEVSNTTFIKMPRTAYKAIAEGWRLSSRTCTNNGRFAGFRYTLDEDYTISLLFDRNGIISGMLTSLPYDEIANPPNGYRYDQVPMFQNETIDGRLRAVLTTYFVRPNTICSTGRTLSDLIRYGTGTGLWLQNGPTPNNLIALPHQRAAASAEGWTDCECYPGMGLHNFYRVDQWELTNCNLVRPAQATYSINGELHGFVSHITGPSKSTRVENARFEVVRLIIGPDRIPPCVTVKGGYGITSLHVWMVDEPWNITCP